MGGSMSIGGFEVKVLTQNDPQLQAYVRNTKPAPHRCDDRVEDFCRVFSGGWDGFRRDIPIAWETVVRCYKSDEG